VEGLGADDVVLFLLEKPELLPRVPAKHEFQTQSQKSAQQTREAAPARSRRGRAPKLRQR
jgi:hypothetical protein